MIVYDLLLGDEYNDFQKLRYSREMTTEVPIGDLVSAGDFFGKNLENWSKSS